MNSLVLSIGLIGALAGSAIATVAAAQDNPSLDQDGNSRSIDAPLAESGNTPQGDESSSVVLVPDFAPPSTIPRGSPVQGHNPCNYVFTPPGFMCVPGPMNGYTIVALPSFPQVPHSYRVQEGSSGNLLSSPNTSLQADGEPRQRNACDDVYDVPEGYACSLTPHGGYVIIPMDPRLPPIVQP